MNLQSLDGRWIGIKVKPRYEHNVARLLTVKGYETYSPFYCIAGCRGQERQAPLFPTYIFLRYNLHVRGTIVTTPGVVRIVNLGPTAATIEDSEIDSVKIMCKSGLNIQPVPSLTIGDTVEIKHGPLRGTRGIIRAFKDRLQLFVSVHLLQRSVVVEISRSWCSGAT